MLAISDDKRPKVCPVASTTYHFLSIVDGLAIKLFIVVPPKLFSKILIWYILKYVVYRGIGSHRIFKLHTFGHYTILIRVCQ